MEKPHHVLGGLIVFIGYMVLVIHLVLSTQGDLRLLFYVLLISAAAGLGMSILYGLFVRST